MDFILDNVLCSGPEDEDRFADIIRGWIKNKEVPDKKKFSKESAKKKAARQKRQAGEAAEADEAAKELGLGSGEDALAQMIMKRQKTREAEQDSFFAHLEQKYGGGGNGKKKTKGKK